MNPITAARKALADHLARPGWTTYRDTPESIGNTPAVVVGNASPYLQPPDTSDGAWWVRAELWLLVSTETNAGAREKLDDLICQVLALLNDNGTDWCWEPDGDAGVEAPLILKAGSDEFTAARIPVAAAISIDQEGA